jgi:bifunctional NMN adenylyltransferase/nudix hydrolase
VRELEEETKIKVPPNVLRGSIAKEKRYDHPGRSLRGRTITTAFHFDLHDKSMPRVRGSDDAAQAKWVPLSEFIQMQAVMYEDHYHIITDLLGLG